MTEYPRYGSLWILETVEEHEDRDALAVGAEKETVRGCGCLKDAIGCQYGCKEKNG
jgi:hypothetical protein